MKSHPTLNYSLLFISALLFTRTALSESNNPAGSVYSFSAQSELVSKSPVPASEWNINNTVATEWLKITKHYSVLEGLSLEKDGGMILSSSEKGAVVHVSPDRKIRIINNFPGEYPGGTAIDRNGRVYVALLKSDFQRGRLVSMNKDGTDVKEVIPESKGFAPNDLVFDKQGGFYFSDFKGTTTTPTGGIYYVSPDLTVITPILKNMAKANGIALSPDGKTLWATEYEANKLVRIDLLSPVKVAPLGTFVPYYFSGPGPDSMRVDSKGNVYVAMMGQGRVLVFAPNGVLIGQVLLPGRNSGHNLISASLAVSPDSDDLYIVAGDYEGGNGAAVYHAGSYSKGIALQ